MSTAPLLSVVMPAYNDAAYIEQAIGSVLAQSFQAFEIIVVDDGSRDDSAERAARLDPRVRVFRQANAGSARARNHGVAQAQADVIAFLDADDWWHPDKLERQWQLRQQVTAPLQYSRFTWWHPTAEGGFESPETLMRATLPALEPEHISSTWLYPELLQDCVVWTSTVMADKALIEQAGGFDETLRKGQDYDLWLKLSHLKPWARLNASTALYRQNQASVTRKATPVNYEYTILKRAVDRWGMQNLDGRLGDARALQRRLARSCVTFGLLHLEHGDPSVAREAFQQAREHGLGGAKALQLQLRARWAAFRRPAPANAA